VTRLIDWMDGARTHSQDSQGRRVDGGDGEGLRLGGCVVAPIEGPITTTNASTNERFVGTFRAGAQASLGCHSILKYHPVHVVDVQF
jgi:hypothetical protein